MSKFRVLRGVNYPSQEIADRLSAMTPEQRRAIPAEERTAFERRVEIGEVIDDYPTQCVQANLEAGVIERVPEGTPLGMTPPPMRRRSRRATRGGGD